MKKLSLNLLYLLLPGVLMAQTPNWAENVAPILYNKCTKCHNNNGVAPMPFETYQHAYDFSAQIKVAVVTKNMPPWPPDRNYRSFAHERTLSAQEIQTISDWVDAGSPQGNAALAPPVPSYGDGTELQTYDMELKMPDYLVNANYDLYRCFVIPSGLLQERYIKDIEVIPGNRSIVHHVLVFQDPSNTPVNLDNNDPGPGYTSFGGTGSGSSKLIAGWVPGGTAFHFPDQMGVKLDANTNIILQVHYPGGTYNQYDSTKIRIRFHPGTARPLEVNPPLNHGDLDNGPLVIPANQTKWFYAQYTVPAQYNVSVLNIAPHMHLIGKKIKVYGVTPASDTIPLIKIDDWDFHWQGFYSFKNVLKIPGGTVLRAEAWYDNTAANHHNPSSPPQLVTAGEGTTDEMMLVYFTYTLYLPGDENISQETGSGNVGINEEDISGIISGMQMYDLYPNPAGSEINVSYALPSSGLLQYRIYDLNGKMLLNGSTQASSGILIHKIQTENLAPGTYILSSEHKGVVKSRKFIKQ